jgi:hypothetical protein
MRRGPIRPDNPVFPGCNIHATEQALDFARHGRLAVDCDLPAGIHEFGQHDGSPGTVGFDLDSRGREGRHLGRALALFVGHTAPGAKKVVEPQGPLHIEHRGEDRVPISPTTPHGRCAIRFAPEFFHAEL